MQRRRASKTRFFLKAVSGQPRRLRSGRWVGLAGRRWAAENEVSSSAERRRVLKAQETATQAVVAGDARSFLRSHANNRNRSDEPGDATPSIASGVPEPSVKASRTRHRRIPRGSKRAFARGAGLSTGRSGFAQVTGIRHWSTPNYTRVAIDLGDDVTYEAARVPSPDPFTSICTERGWPSRWRGRASP